MRQKIAEKIPTRKELKKAAYSPRAHISIIALIVFVEILTGNISDYLSHLPVETQVGILGFVGTFLFVSRIWGADFVINKIYRPTIAALLTVRNEKSGEVDFLLSTEAKLDDVDIVGADDLATKKMPNGAEARLALSYDKAKNQANATWRALADPIDIEADNAAIRANEYLIERELDDARAIKRDATIFKTVARKWAADSVNKRFDEFHSMGLDEATISDLMAVSWDGYEPEKFDVKGVKDNDDNEQEEEQEQQVQHLEENEQYED